RLVELELAAIDHLLAAARAEHSMLGRRRRLLLAARQRLLDVSAALPVDREGARARASFIAREIVRIDRLETVGLATDVGLAHQARQAIDRGDPRRLHAALAAIDAAALASGDASVTRVTGQAIARMWGGADPTSPGAVEASLQASASELLGAEVVTAVQEQIEAVRAAAAGRAAAATNDIERSAADEPLVYFAGADVELLRSTVAVDGCFEVGGALTAVRIVEEDRYIEQVRHPTQGQVLVAAHDAHDLQDALISDPRTVLLDLATGRLLARRFVREEVRRRTRVIARSEVRIYVLDGSGSMRGPRARVRDALLVAELATLIARLKSPGHVRCTLLFRYFDEELGEITRVDSVAGAKAAIRDVVGTMRDGGTDIQKALLASLEQVEVARELDPDLSRAQIVLVTDGESTVDEQAVVAARAVLAGLPIGVSVIALGQENPALRGLVARQRARGEPAFYHFLDDEQLAAIASGVHEHGTALHLPESRPRNALAVARELESEVGSLVEELRSIERERDIAALERLDADVRARRDSGGEGAAASAEPIARDGERARSEALNRDRGSLAARYARWFPAVTASGAGSGPGAAPPRGTKERDEVDAVICALSSVAEVVVLVGGPEL
ncbi:MAG TPA: vWA domain-containing protein, partial [Labilithrix sp.]|nr:vWA domain-containing protein [Labilithrix sp.]